MDTYYYDMVRSMKPYVNRFELRLWEKTAMIRIMMQLRDVGFNIEGIGKLTGYEAEEVDELLKLQDIDLEKEEDNIWVRVISKASGTAYNIIKTV